MNIHRCFYILLPLYLLVLPNVSGQGKYKIVSAGFYNLENLFDTVNDTFINDEEFLPDGARTWTEERYAEKLSNMAYVISQIGISDVKAGLSFFGVSEIENRKVLEDLVVQPSIASRNYQIIHYDSPDGRGVDVGFLYNPAHFHPIYSKAIPLINYEGDKRRFTRDVLYVKGLLENDTIHVLVNHWPSRGGGPASVEYRNNGARLCRSVIDSIFTIDKEAKCLVMGDLNDDPVDESIKKYLRAVKEADEVRSTGMYNPYEALFAKGIGSNAYRDTWSLFDQIILSQGLLKKGQSGFSFFKAQVFNQPFLIQSGGAYKGYPFRTFSGDSYQGGYSDHFPSFIYLIKEI